MIWIKGNCAKEDSAVPIKLVRVLLLPVFILCTVQVIVFTNISVMWNVIFFEFTRNYGYIINV